MPPDGGPGAVLKPGAYPRHVNDDGSLGMPDQTLVFTDRDRAQVKAMSGYGIRQDDICKVFDISPPSLRLHFRRELDLGMIEANAKVGESLFKMATSGNVAAAIFWMKSRAGWREKHEIEVTAGEGVTVFMDIGNGQQTAAAVSEGRAAPILEHREEDR